MKLIRSLFFGRMYGGEVSGQDHSHRTFVANLPPHLVTLLSKEKRWNSYAAGVQKHPDVSPTLRATLVDWLMEVVVEYAMCRFTLHRGIVLLDQFLCCATSEIDSSRLQLVGCSCLLIASKFEEVHGVSVNDLCCVSDHIYNREQIIDMESLILADIGWDLCQPTAYEWLEMWLCAIEPEEALNTFSPSSEDEEDSEVCLGCRALLDCSLMEIDALKYAPSILARGCLNAGQMIVGKRIEPEKGFEGLTIRLIRWGVAAATNQKVDGLHSIYMRMDTFKRIETTGTVLLKSLTSAKRRKKDTLKSAKRRKKDTQQPAKRKQE